MEFYQKLKEIVKKNNSLVCVGLDSELEKLPSHLKQSEYPQFHFNKAIIDATHDIVSVYKPNPAFYEARGAKGLHELKLTCDYIHGIYPEIPIIIDAKRGDIGNTNLGYASYVFDFLRADAITVMPYMGIEALSAFFDRTSKGVIVGCHSSNPGAKEFQEQLILPQQSAKNKKTKEPKHLYEIVAEELMKQQGKNPNAMIFMGATYPEQLAEIRNIVGDMTLLVPGVGAQGGEIKAFVRYGKNSKNQGLMINASRSIIFASSKKDFAIKARRAALTLRDEINKYR